MMIKGFRDKEAEKLFNTRRSRIPAEIRRTALRKLGSLDSARILEDLAASPGNNLQSLKGDRNGQHSIRINDQYRVCFVWQSGNAYHVEIVDYH